jgi:hypothetical protein
MFPSGRSPRSMYVISLGSGSYGGGGGVTGGSALGGGLCFSAMVTSNDGTYGKGNGPGAESHDRELEE